jgi:hypothetical protein
LQSACRKSNAINQHPVPSARCALHAQLTAVKQCCPALVVNRGCPHDQHVLPQPQIAND